MSLPTMRLLHFGLLIIPFALSCVFSAKADEPIGPSSLGPKDVWLVVNKRIMASQAVAEHYCQKRQVPFDHIIALDLHEGEEIAREEYDNKIRKPLREKLAKLKSKEIILLTTYGVPIRVRGVQPSAEDQKRLMLLQQDMQELDKRVKETEKEIAKQESTGDTSRADSFKPTLRTLQQALRQKREQESNYSQKDSHAAVDSELALLWWDDYPLARWIVNTRFFAVPAAYRLSKPPVLLTCRIDGPTPAVAKRLVDDALKAEANGGPRGVAYLDARGIKWEKGGDIVGGSYGGYDESLRELARTFVKCSFRCTLDDKPEVFPAGSCPDCALYCGWYSLDTYIPAFEFNTGSIAYHMASGEAVSLRQKTPRRWVPNLLQDGACVALGPVAEPYLIAFPKPATFFSFLLTGQYTLVECYFLSNHFNSWQMMLIGDPLYRPFAKKPYLKVSDVKLSPIGSQFPLR